MPDRYRLEKDTLGQVEVPQDAYYGAQTVRAAHNFPISGIRPKPVFIKATALVKKAAAAANVSLGLLQKELGEAVMKAADEAASGKYDSEFIVDVYQAGAGTSHNMNANEVIANRANELLGGKKGEYKPVHPNDHVNMSQSTNDAMPTALCVALLLSVKPLEEELNALAEAFDKKAAGFDGILKSGRTHLQDAVPVRLGQEFSSYAGAIKTAASRLIGTSDGLRAVALGGTAVGTGINTHPLFRDRAVEELSKVTGLELSKPQNPFEAQNSCSNFAAFSSSLKNLSLELVRIANDLRLLSSGPRTGIGEITLPPLQPGSSIMPGKVNPVMPEMLDMVSFQVVGNDLTVGMAVQAGQLELNVMLPVINYNLLQSVEILTNAIRAFRTRCVDGIQANAARCAESFERSAGLATILNVFIGYEKAAQVAKEAASTGKTIKEVVLEKGIMDKARWERLMALHNVTDPQDLKKIKP